MNRTAIALLVTMLGTGAGALAQPLDAAIERRIDALLAQMTLEEKVGQLHQLSGRQMTGPGSEKFSDKLADIRNGKVGSMLNVKGVAETREIQALAL